VFAACKLFLDFHEDILRSFWLPDHSLAWEKEKVKRGGKRRQKKKEEKEKEKEGATLSNNKS